MTDRQSTAVPSTKFVAAEPIVKIDSEVTRRIRQHARAHFKTEVCGVLIGESTDVAIDIHASIEALNAAQAGTHVTFTQDAWEEIYKVKDEQYPDARIVGWYHSHPGFGIFLSEHDLFIQENFFSSHGQVAWVYDPHSDDEGCFGWVGGKVARLTSVATLYQSVEPVEHAAKNGNVNGSIDEADREESSAPRSPAREAAPAWARWSQLVLTHLTVLLAGFALAYFVFPRLLAIVPDPATGQIMVVDYHELRLFFKGTGPMPKPVEVVSIPGAPATAAPAAASPLVAPLPTNPGAATGPAQPTAPATAEPKDPASNRPDGRRSGDKSER